MESHKDSKQAFTIALFGRFGKTKLAERFTKNHYIEPYAVTPGITFSSKTISINETDIQLNLRDISSDNKYINNHNLYLANSHVVILTSYTAAFPELRKLEECINIIKQHAPNSTIILASTAIDNTTDQLTTSEQLQTFADKHQLRFFKTSALTGQGVNELFTAAAKIALENSKKKLNEKPQDPKFTIARNQLLDICKTYQAKRNNSFNMRDYNNFTEKLSNLLGTEKHTDESKPSAEKLHEYLTNVFIKLYSEKEINNPHKSDQLYLLLNKIESGLQNQPDTREKWRAISAFYLIKPMLLGAIKDATVSELITLLENKDINDADAVRNHFAVRMENETTQKILDYNRQSWMEFTLKVASFVSILAIVGIFIAGYLLYKRYQDSGKTSFNLFRPLSKDFAEDTKHITDNVMSIIPNR